MEFEAGATPGTYIVTLDDGVTTIQSPEILGESFLDPKYVGGPVYDVGGAVSNFSGDGLTFEVDVLSAPTLDDWAGYIARFSVSFIQVFFSTSRRSNIINFSV